MSENKRKREGNEFIGMSATELDTKAKTYQICIKQYKSEIKEKQAEIKALEENIKRATNCLHRIETARNKTSEIEYTSILTVYTKKGTAKKNPKVNYSYFSPSDYKEFVYYNFVVEKVNKKDYNKASTCLYCSADDGNIPQISFSDRGYRASEKKLLQQHIIAAIKAFAVEEVYFIEDVSLGKAEIEKVLKKPVKTKTKYGRYE